ncbi:hypothetical protein [Amycolatopsis vastitatis]|uniref:hypothetical protein n=1 Tax=Amycolatopsis vastitatis TaxID=1905142 RepID=UPI001178A10C|nr:hypothetical protein [Amycolatopsis vastitatis]
MTGKGAAKPPGFFESRWFGGLALCLWLGMLAFATWSVVEKVSAGSVALLAVSVFLVGLFAVQLLRGRGGSG